jgi:molybdopterin converting factor subunit 1
MEIVRIHLRYFASIREALGRRQEELDVPDGATVATVWQRLTAERPQLAGQRFRPAINEEYVDPSAALKDGDVLVFIPPVSGGAAEPVIGGAEAAICRLTDEPIEAQELVEAVRTPADGAVPGQTPDRVGPYRIIRRLGAGGMGVVYLGEHETTGQQAAVKLIRPELAANEEFRTRRQRQSSVITDTQ